MSGSTSFDYKLFANLANDNVVFVTRLKDNAVHTHMAKVAVRMTLMESGAITRFGLQRKMLLPQGVLNTA